MKDFTFRCEDYYNERSRQVEFRFSTENPEDVVAQLEKFFVAISLEMPGDSSGES